VSIYSLTLLLVTIFSLYLGCSVYYRDKGNAINRIFFIYALTGAFLSFTSFMTVEAGDYTSAYFWVKAGFLWPVIPSILFRLILSVTDTNTGFFNKFVFGIALFLSSVLFVLSLTTNLLSGRIIETGLGWYYHSPSHWILYIFILWTMFLTCYSCFLIVRAYIASTNRQKRKQYMLILSSVMIPLVFSTINYLLLAIFGIRVPGLYNYSFFLSLLLIWLGMVRFQLFPFISSVEIILSSIQEAMILVDSKGIILSINKHMLDFSGYLESELTGKHISSVFTGNYDYTSETSRELVFVTKDKKEIEQVVFMSQVSNLNSQFSGYMYMLWNDVKAIKSSIDLLRQKELLRTIINSFPYPFMIINTEDYSLDIINNAAMQLSAGDHSSCYALSHRSDKPCSGLDHPCPMAEVLRTGKGTMVEHVHFSPNGTPMDVEVHAYPIRDENEKIVKMIVFHFDISKRKQALAELVDAKERAEKSDLAKTEFLEAMSHEVRTPLNSIIGFSDLLVKNGSSLSEEQRQFSSYISKSGRHLADILGSILDYVEMEDINSDKPAGSRQVFILSELFNGALETVKAEADNMNLSFSIDIDPETESFSVNKNIKKLRVVLSNLISNAVKFSREGETVFIVAKIKEEFLSVSIKNTGKKLDYNYAEKIFEPFFQESGGMVGKTPGIGLGLTMVRRLLETLNGSIRVDSCTEDSFTQFTFEIPLAGLSG